MPGAAAVDEEEEDGCIDDECHDDDDNNDDNVVDMEEEGGEGIHDGSDADDSVAAVADAVYKLAHCHTSSASSSSSDSSSSSSSPCVMSVDQDEEGEAEEEEDEEASSTLRILSAQAPATTMTTATAASTVPRRPPSGNTHPHLHLHSNYPHLHDVSHTTTMSRNSSESDLSDCGAKDGVAKGGAMLLTLTSLAECAERAARAPSSSLLGEYHSVVPCQALRPRSDSMAETDVEEEFSPELSALVAGANASPPPQMLPPAADPTGLGLHKNKGQDKGQDKSLTDSQVYSINNYHSITHPSSGKGGLNWTLLAAAQASFSPRSKALLQLLDGQGQGQGGDDHPHEQGEEAV